MYGFGWDLYDFYAMTVNSMLHLFVIFFFFSYVFVNFSS
uniref:Uncharacterized protein n=1 Tax=Rhizophora mucronata TaxID=61149 RepID=A0A2P2IK65_RHIMU